jgi:hypothetical protein
MLRTLHFEQRTTSLVGVVVRRNADYKKEDHLLSKMRKVLELKLVLGRNYRSWSSKVVIVRSRVHSVDDAVDSVENIAIMYEPVKIRKKYLRILILSSLDNLINSFAMFLMISYNAKKKIEIRLC